MPSKPPPRIFKLTYRAAIGRKRKVSVWIKVPYAGLFNLLDVMGRAVATSQVMWFRLDVPPVITAEMRQSLLRWPMALSGSSRLTGVDWNE
jgi:hypothetical protein